MLTRSGRTLIGLSAVLALAGLALGYTELLVLAIACALVVAAAAIWVLSRPKLSAERVIQPVRVIEGQPASAELTVVNEARRRSPAMVALEQFGTSAVEVAIPSLEPGGVHRKPYRLPTERRGVFNVGPLMVSRSDPFSIMQTGQDQRSIERLWVHPATHLVTPFPSGRARDLEGPTSGEAPEGGIAFHALREYVVGDDLRLVHWRSSARAGSLLVRHNVDTNQPRTLVVLDTRADIYADDSFEHAVRVAASIVLASTQNHFPVSISTTCGTTMSADRGGQPEAIFDMLAALEVDGEASLQKVARFVGEDSRGFSLAVVTGQASATDLAAIGPLRTRFDTVTIGRIGAGGRGSAHQLPGALLINASTSADFCQAWNRRVRR